MRKILCLSIICSLAWAPLEAFAQKTMPAPVRPWKQGEIPAPPGMVYVPGGTIRIKYGKDDDSVNVRQYSLSPFFMDKGEVTNRQYREFIQWVIDSVAVTSYLKNDRFFHKKGLTDSNQRRINWDRVRNAKIWKTRKGSIRSALGAMYEEGEIKRSLYTYVMKYTKAKPGSRSNGKRVTEVINVYPNTSVWVTDFPNSQVEMMAQQYFTNPAFDDYPVVGVSWKQARAYTNWRSNVRKESNYPKFMRKFQMPYMLPTEAQWVHAAIGFYSDEGEKQLEQDIQDLRVNYKQDEGDFTGDGASYTVPVLSYAPNKYGIYNLLGNVTEWMYDTYTQSSYAFAHDQNPVIAYDADSTDGMMMHAKVLRGGSWKDAARNTNPNYRNFDLDNVQHSYIGFRCVMQAPEAVTKKLKTKAPKKKKANNIAKI